MPKKGRAGLALTGSEGKFSEASVGKPYENGTALNFNRNCERKAEIIRIVPFQKLASPASDTLQSQLKR